MSNLHQFRQFSVILFFALITAASLFITDIGYSKTLPNDQDWIIPGKNVKTDQLYIKIHPLHTPLNVKDYDGIAFTGISSLDAVADAFGVYRLEKAFILPAKVMDNPLAPVLDCWYGVHFPSDYDLFDIKKTYNACPEVEIAEFSSIYKTCFTPNDPQFHRQWHLEHCGFPAAWDVSHGSEDVIVGIIDSGIDMELDEYGSQDIHEDLRDNIWVNPGEDLNGDGIITLDDWDELDNDENGYINDFFGWDFIDDDNWPDDYEAPDFTHGTHIASDVSAVTNNGIGVAGAGFSCKVMVAGCNSRQYPGHIENTEPAIVYCSSNGARIINLSYGSFNPENQFSREAIEFAQYEGSIIFAAAGNDTTRDHRELDEHYYPCAYDGVIGVASSDSRDLKVDFSNWGDYIDLVAPGLNVRGCWGRGGYSSRPGTSVSSPMAAGLGALMLSVMPDLTGEELLERMQATATDISNLNEDYLGIRYRINADLLLNSTHPGFEVAEWSIYELEGDGDGRAERHERVAIPLTISNIAGYVDAINAHYLLQTDDPTIRIEREQENIGNLASGDRFEIGIEQAPIFHVTWCHPHYSSFNLTVTSDEEWEIVFELPLTIGQPYYLLVDDDGGDDIDSYYEADLDVHPFVHDTWNIENDRFPDQDWLNEFQIVIWETGNAREALSNDEIALIERYLNNGGTLILIGQYIGVDHGDSEFFPDYLHVRHLDDNGGGPWVDGIEGNPISDGHSFLLYGATGAGNNDSTSTMEPLDDAEALFMYRDFDVAGAVFYANDTYKVIYMGFAFEAASGLGGSSERHEFIETALNHLFPVDVDETPGVELPEAFSLSKPWPNPFNATVEVKVDAPVSGHFRLEVIDVTGRQISSLHSGNHYAGSHNFTWNAHNVTTGEYFFHLSWNDGSIIQKMVLVK